MRGLGAVGKSAFSIQFVKGLFVSDYDPTIAENYRKVIIVDGKTVQLEIFDTAGMENFDSMIATTLRGGDVFIFLYDITDHHSFECLKDLYEELQHVTNKERCPCVICANKSDLKDQKAVETEEGENFARSIGAPFFETSAKTNTNIDEAFHEAVRVSWRMCQENDIKQHKTEEEIPWYKKCILI